MDQLLTGVHRPCGRSALVFVHVFRDIYFGALITLLDNVDRVSVDIRNDPLLLI